MALAMQQPVFDQAVAGSMMKLIIDRKPFERLIDLREKYGSHRCELINRTTFLLHHAIKKNYLGWVKALIEEDTSRLELFHVQDGQRPLHAAIERYRLRFLQIINPYHLLVFFYSQSLIIMGYLLGKGVEINAVDRSGKGPLHMIASFKKMNPIAGEMMNVVLEFHPDVKQLVSCVFIHFKPLISTQFVSVNKTALFTFYSGRVIPSSTQLSKTRIWQY